jgi:hypothetical protein
VSIYVYIERKISRDDKTNWIFWDDLGQKFCNLGWEFYFKPYFDFQFVLICPFDPFRSQDMGKVIGKNFFKFIISTN